MFQAWQPLVDPSKKEQFVSEEESRSIVGGVFIGVGLMIFASILALLFYWTYNKEKTLFIAVFSGFVFLFSIKMVILVAAIRAKLRDFVFKMYIGSTVFMSLTCLFLMIFFSIKASKKMSERSSLSSAPYVPSAVSSYINPPPMD